MRDYSIGHGWFGWATGVHGIFTGNVKTFTLWEVAVNFDGYQYILSRAVPLVPVNFSLRRVLAMRNSHDNNLPTVDHCSTTVHEGFTFLRHTL
jgi:hypothetical protein